MWVYLNGKFVEQEQACVSVFDHGFLYGDGVYETCRVYGGRIFLLDRHVARLRQSCEWIGLDHALEEETWVSIISELLSRNELTDAGVRLTVSRGEGELSIDPSVCARPTIVVMAKALMPNLTRLRETGVQVQLVSVRRNPPAAQSPQIKSLSFLNNILAKQEANRVGAFDALMLNMDGWVTECTTSNVFFIKQQQLYTPAVDCGILEGITREVVMELARTLGIPVEEGQYAIEDMLHSDECFMTNTGVEILPVSHINQRPIGQGTVGPITKRLMKDFQDNLGQYLGPSLF